MRSNCISFFRLTGALVADDPGNDESDTVNAMSFVCIFIIHRNAKGETAFTSAKEMKG